MNPRPGTARPHPVTPRLWQVTIVTSPEAEDPVAAILQRLWNQPASTFQRPNRNTVSLSVHLSHPPDTLPQWRHQLREAIARLRDLGLDPTPARIRQRVLPAQDWAESWKHHFPPLEIGQTLLIRPGWIRRPPRPGQQVIVLDPGLSFGTGHHPTTAFCLRQVVACRRTGQRQSFLDIGTGSGLLAIAAAKLGYHPIRALDLDPTAVRVARANARRNRTLAKIRFASGNIGHPNAAWGPPAEVVAANLTANLLLNARHPIARQVRPGGALILAGILRTEFDRVVRAYEGLGFRLVRRRNEREWTSGRFLRDAAGR